TDFCRRAWRAGSDVVLAPKARVRHAQATMYGRDAPDVPDTDHRRTYAMRRAAEWYHGLAWAPTWALPFLALAVIVTTVGRTALRVAASDIRMIGAELRAPVLL